MAERKIRPIKLSASEEAFIVAPFKNYSWQTEHQDFGFMSVDQPNAIGIYEFSRVAGKQTRCVYVNLTARDVHIRTAAFLQAAPRSRRR